MNDQGSSNIKGPVLLLLTAFIWGTAFVAQSVGTEYMGPFTFNMSRSLLAGLFHTKLYLPATGAGVPYTSGFNTASGVASIVAADEGDEESRVLYNNGDGTWIDENGNLYEE